MTETVTRRLMIPASEAAALPLTEFGPIPPSMGEPLDGPMHHRGVQMWSNEAGTVFTGLWECDAGRLRTSFDIGGGECIHVVSGRMLAHADDGTTTELGPGDAMTFPPGWSGIWECVTPFRKFYTVFSV